MFEIVRAPSEMDFASRKSIKLFLAGGISNCEKWQEKLIVRLLKDDKFKNEDVKIIVFNPRCDKVPDEKNQITWEYKRLKKSNIVSFWFSVGSLNPITLFEYGVQLNSKKKIVVGCHPEYSKKNNVVIQTELARPTLKVNENFENFYNGLVKTLINEIDLFKIKHKK